MVLILEWNIQILQKGSPEIAQNNQQGFLIMYSMEIKDKIEIIQMR
jgi:hypothetical protein